MILQCHDHVLDENVAHELLLYRVSLPFGPSYLVLVDYLVVVVYYFGLEYYFAVQIQTDHEI